MRRWKFIFALGGAAVAWPFAARGQSDPAVQRISLLMGLLCAQEVLE